MCDYADMSNWVSSKNYSTRPICCFPYHTVPSRPVRPSSQVKCDVDVDADIAAAAAVVGAQSSHSQPKRNRGHSPFLTSHMRHLNASAEFLYVQTLQSQWFSSITFAWRFCRRTGDDFLSIIQKKNAEQRRCEMQLAEFLQLLLLLLLLLTLLCCCCCCGAAVVVALLLLGEALGCSQTVTAASFLLLYMHTFSFCTPLMYNWHAIIAFFPWKTSAKSWGQIENCCGVAVCDARINTKCCWTAVRLYRYIAEVPTVEYR